MRYPKFTAALAAFTLTLGGLALAGPALAEDGTSNASPTQEVASSPDTSSQSAPMPSTSPTSTVPDVGAQENTPTTPTPEAATPISEPSVDPVPPTEPTTSTDSSEKPVSTPAEASSPLTTSTGPSDTPAASPVEGWWAMPNGGTGDNVTWPQAVASADSLQCGIWYQVDTYPSADVLTGLQADGQLDQGEDYSTVISWRFVYGGDCPPAPGPANPAATIETQCGAASVTVTNDGENILTASVVIYLDGDFFTALAVPAGQSVATPLTFAEDSGDHVISVRTGPAFGDVELARAENINSDCIEPPVVVPPVVTPPTETPTPEAATPTEARTIAAQEVASEKLAATGSDVEGYVQIGAWAAGLMLLAGLVIILIRRRVPKQK